MGDLGERPAPGDEAGRSGATASRGRSPAGFAASGWATFGTGVAVGLVVALSAIAAISMIYPSPSP